MLEKLCIREGLRIRFEYTSPGSPQYNGKVERNFVTLYGRTRTMLSEARLPKHISNGVWTEAAATASYIEYFLVTATKPTTAYIKFYKITTPKLKFLRKFGEFGIVEINNTRNHQKYRNGR
jgi:hypothetical protein